MELGRLWRPSSESDLKRGEAGLKTVGWHNLIHIMLKIVKFIVDLKALHD
jgi:hypothetical protein